MKKLLWATIVLLGLGAPVVILLQAVSRQRDAASATACRGCLTSIAVAMLNYHEKYGRFPPAYLADSEGKPVHSWRVLLLEFFESELYEQYKFNEPWDGPNNRKLERSIPNCYCCPGDPNSKARYRTNYFVVVGDRTPFPIAKTASLDDVKRPRGSTILVVESVGEGIHWMEPKDLRFDSMSFVLDDKARPSVSSYHRGGPRVCMVDATTIRLVDIGPDDLKEMLTIR